MNRLFLIFVILFSCGPRGEETIPDFQCRSMTLSDALPVQFWQQGCSTYNQTVPKGVHEKCWCAPWLCDDQIRIQFQEDYSPDADYSLLVKDEDGLYLAELTFDEITAGVHSVAFSPETEGICDEVIALEICGEDDVERLISPNGWTEPSAPFDSRDAGAFYHNIDSSTGVGGLLAYQAVNIPADPDGTDVAFDIRIVITGTFTFSAAPAGNGIKIRFYLADSSGTEISTDNTDQILFTTADTYLITAKLTAEAAASRLYIRVDEINMASGSADIEVHLTGVNQLPGVAIYAPALAYSDCLDVKLAHDETELLEYSNARNFAGLIHSDISPDATFNVRVPCRFFHEVFPEEDEAIELTSSVITTSGQLKSQKLLEVQHVPYYFHKKLQLILKHQTLTINGTDYQKEEKYEIIQGNKQWPLKSATCLLTEKNSVLRNVI